MIYACTDSIRIKQNKLSLLFNILVMHLLKGVDRDINVNISKVSAYSSSEKTHRLHLQQQQERVRTHHWLYETQLSKSMNPLYIKAIPCVSIKNAVVGPHGPASPSTNKA